MAFSSQSFHPFDYVGNNRPVLYLILPDCPDYSVIAGWSPPSGRSGWVDCGTNTAAAFVTSPRKETISALVRRRDATRHPCPHMHRRSPWRPNQTEVDERGQGEVTGAQVRQLGGARPNHYRRFSLAESG